MTIVSQCSRYYITLLGSTLPYWVFVLHNIAACVYYCPICDRVGPIRQCNNLTVETQ